MKTLLRCDRWLQWGGRQAVLFDLEVQRSFIFGLLLYPHDLIFLASVAG